MTYVCYYTVEYDCHTPSYPNFKKVHERPSGYGTGSTAEEALENMKVSFTDMRSAYERSGWHTEDFKDAFMAEKDGSRNYFYGINVRQVDGDPVRTEPKQTEPTTKTITLEEFVAQCKAAGLSLEQCKELAKSMPISW